MLPSRYQSIWKLLKDSPGKPIKLSAIAAGHSRLKRAIIKRKDIDTGYKYLLQEQGKVAKLEFTSSGNILVVVLTIRSNYLAL